MSRQPYRRLQGGPKLPFALQHKLALNSDNRKQARRRSTTQVGSRKEQRREIRRDRRKSDIYNDRDDRKINEDEDEDETSNEQESIAPVEGLPKNEARLSSHSQPFRPKSILRKRKADEVREPSPTSSNGLEVTSRDSSPGLVLDAHSRTFKDRMAQDDAEIAALERRLSIRKGKKQKKEGDEFDDILGGIGSDSNDDQGQEESKRWLELKRQQALKSDSESNSSHGSDEGNETESDDVSQVSDEADDQKLVAENTESEDGLDFDEENFEVTEDLASKKDTLHAKRVRENPYKPPISTEATSTKYIPPSLRKRSDDDAEKLERLRKQIQGQLNKLSEANIISILGEVEKLYQSNPRQDTTGLLIENILSAFSTRSSLQNTFIILHAAFLAGLYKILGNDFGAELVCKLVERFDNFHSDGVDQGKESLNLISLLANLFTFNIVSSAIIYDHVRLLLSDFSEKNAELLLRIVRDCGPQLRSDDPTALKNIVQIMHKTSAEIAKEGKQLNIRTRVMMDTITDLKNNKVRQATNVAGMTGEHITRMRKALGTLNNRQLRGTEPLRISKEDIKNSERKGKWWLVGASWTGNTEKSSDLPISRSTNNDRILQNDDDLDYDPEVDFASLARHYKMNTDVRRSIFVAVMSAEDVHDALSRIGKLRLTRKQEPEIARVLLRCCRAEPKYNQYYAILARNLLKDRRYKMSFEIALWKFFAALGETGGDEEDPSAADFRDEMVELHEIVNVAKMHAFLVSKGSIRLDVLKTLDIGFTKEQGTLFLEVFFVSMLHQSNLTDDHIRNIFGRIEARLVKSLKYFMREKVQRSDLVGRAERPKLKDRCKVAYAALDMVETLNERDSD